MGFRKPFYNLEFVPKVECTWKTEKYSTLELGPLRTLFPVEQLTLRASALVVFFSLKYRLLLKCN